MNSRVDVARLPRFAIVLDGLFESQAGKVTVGLLDLRYGRVLDVDVEGDDLDAGIHRALRGILHGFRQPVLDDDAVDAERDRLVHHVGLEGGVLAAVEDAQVDAERLGLGLHARQIGLEEVAGREIAHQRDLDIARVVERRRLVLRRGERRPQQGGSHEAGGEPPEVSTRNSHAFLHILIWHFRTFPP